MAQILTEIRLAEIVLTALRDITRSPKGWTESLLLDWGELALIADSIESRISGTYSKEGKCHDVSDWNNVANVYSGYARMHGLNPRFNYENVYH